MKIRTVAWLIAVFGLIASAVAEAAGPLSAVTSVAVGAAARDVVIDGDRAYVATNSGLTIVDIASPAAPVVLGSLNASGQIMGLALKGSHVYLANRTKDLQVVNVADPAAPVLVATRSVSSYAWDVAVKDNVAYLATFAGELFLFDISNPAAPVQIKVLGIWEWTSAGQDATNLAKLNSYVTSGNAKITGVSVSGNSLAVTGWNYGRFFYYDVTDAASPVFKGTHYAPFLFRSEIDPDQEAGYSLAAFGNSSGLYSVVLSSLGPNFSTRAENCTSCDYLKTTATDYGGLAVSSTGRYVVAIFGKKGTVQVFDVSNPTDIKSAGLLNIPAHGTKTGEPMGVAIKGDYIFTASGTLGLQVWSFAGLSN